jgi:hypothetical protein
MMYCLVLIIAPQALARQVLREWMGKDPKSVPCTRLDHPGATDNEMKIFCST